MNKTTGSCRDLFDRIIHFLLPVLAVHGSAPLASNTCFVRCTCVFSSQTPTPTESFSTMCRPLSTPCSTKNYLSQQEMTASSVHSERRVARNELKLAGIRVRQKEEKTKK